MYSTVSVCTPTNFLLTVVQESNADQAIKALTAALAPKAKAIRNGKAEVVDATQLVPGDIVVVRLGEIVPADIKLMGETGEEDHPMQARAPAMPNDPCQSCACCNPCCVSRHFLCILLASCALRVLRVAASQCCVVLA